jgi:hypothetical protein
MLHKMTFKSGGGKKKKKENVNGVLADEMVSL